MTRINVYGTVEITGDYTLLGWFDDDAVVETIEEHTRWDGNNNRGIMSGLQLGSEDLLRTKGGRWVTRHDGRREYNGQLVYEFLTDAQARDWLLRNGSDDVVERYFGEIEEERGPGRPTVGGGAALVLFGRELLTKIDAAAAEAGSTRADWLRGVAANAVDRAEVDRH